MILLSAMFTGAMLFVNGSVVLAFLRAFGRTGSEWARDPRITQFLLLSIPVLMVVMQWMVIDYVRTRISWVAGWLHRKKRGRD